MRHRWAIVMWLAATAAHAQSYTISGSVNGLVGDHLQLGLSYTKGLAANRYNAGYGVFDLLAVVLVVLGGGFHAASYKGAWRPRERLGIRIGLRGDHCHVHGIGVIAISTARKRGEVKALP